MERVALLNGPTKNQDYDLSALGLSLTTGWVYEGLVLSNTGGNNWKVTKGKALVLCTKTTGNRVLAHYEMDTDKTFSQVGPFKIWVEINQANVDNPTANNAAWSWAWSIQYGAAYPVSGPYLALWEVDATNAITLTPASVSQNVANTLLTVIQSWGSNFYALTTGTGNSYVATYGREVPTNGTPSDIAKDVTFYARADKSNTGNVIVSINTTAGTLTAALKKMNDQDLGPGDLEAGLVFGFMWDGTNFQMTTPTAQAPVGTATTVSTTGQVWEATGSIAWRPAFVGSGIRDTRVITQSTGWWSYNFGNGTDIRLEQSIISDNNSLVKNIKVNLRKVWSPTDNIIVRLLDKNRNVIATSTTTLSWGTVTASFVSYTFAFSYPNVNPNVQFEIDFSRSWSQDAANYYQIEATGNYDYPHWSIQQFNGTGYTYRDGSITMTLQFARYYESGKRYLSDTDYQSTSVIDGIFEQSKPYNDNCLITLSGTNNNQVWLTPWSNYFLDIFRFDKNLVSNADTHFWYKTSNQERIAQQIVLGSWLSVNKILLNLYRVGTPIDDMVIRIETDNNNNEPSGTLVHANAVATVWPLKLTTSANGRIDIFNFSGSFNLEAGTKYWIVLQRTGALSTSNYYRARINNATVYTNGLFKTYTNSARVTQTKSLFFSFLESFNGQDVNQYGERSVATPNSDDIYIGYSRDDNMEQAQMMIHDSDLSITDLSLHVRKDGNPTDSLEIRIESNIEETPTTLSWDLGTTSRSGNVDCGTTSIQKQASSLTTTDTTTFQSMDVYMSLRNNPTDGLTFRIETDNAGLPSGTLVNPDATVTISNINTYINAWAWYYAVHFPKAMTIAPQKIRLVISRTWSLDNANFVRIGKWNDQTLSSQWTQWNGTAWAAVTAHALTFAFGAAYMQNKPSGSLIHANATITIPAANLTTSYQLLTFAFPWAFTIPKNTKYWIRVRRPDARNYSTVNFYRIRSNNGGTYGYGYTLTLENRSRNDSLFSRNMVLFFNKVYQRFKYLRKDNGALPVWRSIAATQVTLFPVLPPRDVISLTNGQIVYTQFGGLFWVNAKGTWGGWGSGTFGIYIEMSDDGVTNWSRIGHYSEWLHYNNNAGLSGTLPKNKYFRIIAYSSAGSVTVFNGSYMEIK